MEMRVGKFERGVRHQGRYDLAAGGVPQRFVIGRVLRGSKSSRADAGRVDYKREEIAGEEREL